MPRPARSGGRAKLLAALLVFAAALAATAASAADFMVPRYAHSAALMTNGKILVAGGIGLAGTPLNTVEILDTTLGSEFLSPAQGGFATSMNVARASATITVLTNGKVLVTGGWGGASALNSAEVYDPGANTWTNTGNMNSPRFNHTATLLLTGKVLVCGGQTDGAGTVTNLCDLYDPTANTFAATGPMLLARALHTATILNDGTVWVAGGWNNSASNSNPPFVVTTERYSTATGAWTQAQPLKIARAYHTATLTGDNKVLIAGGYNGRDLQTTLFIPQEAATLSIDVPSKGVLPTSELFDPTGGAIIPGPPLQARVREHAAALLPSGLVSIYGGRGNVPPVNLTDITSPEFTSGQITGTFQALTSTAVNHNATGGSGTADIAFDLASGVSGHIIDGDIEFINPQIALDGGHVQLISNLDSPGTGLRASLAGSTVTCDSTSCGHLSGAITFQNFGTAGGIYQIEAPSITGNLLASQPVASGALTINNSPISLSVNAGIADVTAGNFTTHLQITMPDYVVGQSVTNVTLGLNTTASVSWTEVSSYTVVLTGGGGVAAGPFTVQASGTGSGGYIDIPAFTFTGVSGQLTVISDDSSYSISNSTLSNIPIGGAAKLDSANFTMSYTAGGINLSSQTLTFESADIIIRDMIFGDNEYFVPKTNQWTFVPDGSGLTRPAYPRTGAASVVTPSGAEFDIGGRDCSTACGSIVAISSPTAGERHDYATLWLPASADANTIDDPMTHAYHSGTLLPDGTILLAGGTDGSSVLRSAEVFDPVTKNFTPTTTLLNYPRQQHSASLLPNGRVLLAGGFTTDPSTGPTNTAEIYYPDTRVFEKTSLMISSHSQHVAVTLPDGDVFVAGGYKGQDTVTGSAEIFYSTMSTWASLADMTTLGALAKRALAAAVQLQDGRIMLCGGTNESGILSSVIAYDPATNAWSSLASMPTQLSGHTATLLFDGRVLVAGGNDGFGESRYNSFIYDPGLNTWSTINHMQGGRSGHSANLLPNGTVLVTGGIDSLATSASNAKQSMEFYTPDSASWSDGSGADGTTNNDVPTYLLASGPRAFHTATLAPDGRVYFIGGADGVIGNGSTFYKKNDSVYFTVAPDQFSVNAPSLRQSTITATTASSGPVLPGSSFNVTGLRFRGATEASGGSGSAAASFSTPRLMLQKVDASNGGGANSSPGFVANLTPLVYSNPANETTLDTSLTVTLPSNNALPYGWYQAWVGAVDIHTNKAPFVQVGPAKPASSVVMQSPIVLGISSVTYTWTGFAGVDGYNVYSATTGVFITSIAYAGTGVAGTSFTQTNLLPNTTTSVLVAGYTITGDGPLTASATTFTLSTAPTNVRITSVTFNSLLLQWDANGNTPGTVYEVSQSTDWPSPFSQSVSTPVPAFLFTTANEVQINSLQANTTYTFRLQAYNTAGSSSTFSVWATTATRSNVVGVTGKALSSTSIEWSWNDAGPVTYRVYNATNSAVIITTTTTDFTQTGLGVNSQHSIVVSAITGAGEGPLSDSATAYTLANVPGSLTPGMPSVSTFSFSVNWSANGNPFGTDYTAIFYEFLDDSISASTVTTSGFLLDTTAFGNLRPSTRYDVTVQATNGAGVRTDSLVISSYTLAARPVFLDPVFLQVTPTSIGLQWDKQGNSTHTIYEVTYSTDPTFTVALATAIPFSSQYHASSATLTGLITSFDYYIRVRAQNPLGQTTQYSFSTHTVTVNGGAPSGSLAGPLLALTNSTISGNLGDGRFVDLTAPAGSFPSDTVATLTPFNVVAGTTLCPRGFNVAVIINDDPALQPTSPVYLTEDFAGTDIGSVPTSQIALARYVGVGVCTPLDTTFDTSGARPKFRARLNHFSTYQLVQIPLAASPANARIFPNPYRAAKDNYVTFDNVPPGARIRVMTLRGETILDQKANSYGLLTWSGSNGGGRFVASGLYIVLIESGGNQKILKLAVIR